MLVELMFRQRIQTERVCAAASQTAKAKSLILTAAAFSSLLPCAAACAAEKPLEGAVAVHCALFREGRRSPPEWE